MSSTVTECACTTRAVRCLVLRQNLYHYARTSTDAEYILPGNRCPVLTQSMFVPGNLHRSAYDLSAVAQTSEVSPDPRP
eukprot:2219619-Rhodomonas_salina.1